jgi:hypothetical protein
MWLRSELDKHALARLQGQAVVYLEAKFLSGIETDEGCIRFVIGLFPDHVMNIRDCAAYAGKALVLAGCGQQDNQEGG